MAVVVGRMVAILEAQTAAFEARMSAAGQQLSRWNSATSQAHRGTMLLKGGLQQLAFEGLGGMPPALSRVATGALALFGPGGVLLVAIAVLGALSMAFERAAKKAEELEEENRRVRDSQMAYNKMLASIGPGFQQTPAEQLANLALLRGRALEMQEGIRAGAGGPLFEIVKDKGDPAALRAQQRIDSLTVAIRGFDRAILLLTNTMNNAANEMRNNIIGAAKDIALGFSPLMKQPSDSMRWKSQIEWLPSKMPGEGGKATIERWLNKNKGFQVTPEVLQMLLFSMMAMQQGGAGAGMAMGGMLTALSGMPGIAGKAAAGPLGWIGFGISALASIFGQKSDEARAQAERHHRELIAAIHEGPIRVSNYFEGDPEQSLYQNRRLERLGGEPRNGGL